MTTIWALLQGRHKRSPGEPVVTFVAADGARTELSATTLANTAAKIANALADEFDLVAGDRVGLRLPAHWQRAAWLAGCWTAGCVAVPGAPADADGPGVDLVVTTAGAAQPAGPTPTVAVSLHPLGLPVAEPLPDGVADATLAVRLQPDAFWGIPPTAHDPALAWEGVVLDQAAVLDLARTRASTWGLAPGGRLLVGPDVDPLDGWLAALAVPLAAVASVVLVDGAHDLEDLARQERATTSLR